MELHKLRELAASIACVGGAYMCAYGIPIACVCAYMCAGPKLHPNVQAMRQRMGRTMKELHSRCQDLHARENFTLGSDDIVVAVPAKSGTTWLMHIAHQIRMKGAEPDFDDQMDVIPWIDPHGPALAITDAINRQQCAKPRVFKSHAPYLAFTKGGLSEGGKLIYCFRDLTDVCVSSWKFLPPMFGFTTESPDDAAYIPLDAWADGQLGQAHQLLNNLCDWWEQRNNPRVLLLFFDDLKLEHEATVRKIAAFMGEGGLDDATIAKVVETTTHQCMSSADHHARFDDHRIARAFAEINDLPWPRELTGKVRKTGGKSGEGSAKLAQAHCDAFARAWSNVVSARLGFKDLRAMRAAWKKEQAAGPWGIFHLSGESNLILDASA